MANRKVREKLENDPNREMSHVPGSYNPGNQAGKDVQSGGQRPADESEGPFLGRKEDGKRSNENPRQTGTPERKR